MTGPLVLLAGEPEYLAHQSMPPVAAEIAERLGLQLEVRIPDVIADEPDFPTSSFGDLSVLEHASLLIVYTRFRVLVEDNMQALQRYLQRGAPILGLRTSTHAFHFPADSAWAEWNRSFGADVLGSPWISHHGHSSSTDVTPLPNVPAQLTAGTGEGFHVRSWLYHTELASWATPLLIGTPIDPEVTATPGPVAWYGSPTGRRTFYTSLGHPDDLRLQPVRRLLVNAAQWMTT